MKKVILLLAVVLLIAACKSPAEKAAEASIEAQTGGNADVDISGNSMTVQTDDGNMQIQGTTANEDEWCKAGSKWSMAGSDATANMVIVGIISTGKYAGMCHVKYDVSSEQGQGNIDYYFDQDGNGYQVAVINGQTYESAWTGQQ